MGSTPPNKGELIGRGRTAEIFEWPDNRVIKLFFDWCPLEWIQREVQVGQMLVSTSLPTPRFLDTVSLDGRQGIIFEKVEGPSMLSLLGTRPWYLFRSAMQFAELQFAIHEQDGGALSPILPHLEASIEQAKGLPASVRNRLLSSLADLPSGDVLCHFDFHPDQVVIAGRGPTILDWMTAHKGHPMADVARSSTLIRFAQAPYANWFMRTATIVVRSTFHDRYIKRYMQLHPQFTADDLKPWLAPVAAARLAEQVPGEEEQILTFLKASVK